jgi:plastocyanin
MLTVTVPLILILVAGMLLVNPPGRIDARQGTPAAGTPAGVTVQVLGRGESAVVPDRELVLRRRTFAPGASTAPHPANGPVVLSVESGTVGFTVVEGAALLSRAALTGTPAPAEAAAVGTEVVLAPGDAVFYDEGVVHVVRNTGEGVAVTVEARLPRADETLAEAKPGASPAADTPVAGVAGDETVQVDIKDFVFGPASVTIPVGGSVTWTNRDTAPHTATAQDRGVLQSGTLKEGESYTATFDTPGTYEYFCEFHPDMEGTVVVH